MFASRNWHLIQSWRREIATQPRPVTEFPKSVVDGMRAAPVFVGRPPPTEAALQLKFTNGSNEVVYLNGDVYCDCCEIKISVSSDRAYRIPTGTWIQTAEHRLGRTVTLKPGQSHVIKLNRLQFGNRGIDGICLRTPGKYPVTIKYSCRSMLGAPRDGLPVSCTATTAVEVILKED